MATYYYTNMALMSEKNESYAVRLRKMRSFAIGSHHRKEMYTHEPFLSRRTEVKYRLIGLVGCKWGNAFSFQSERYLHVDMRSVQRRHSSVCARGPAFPCMLHSTHPIFLDFITLIIFCWAVEDMRLLVLKLHPAFYYFLPLRPKIFSAPCCQMPSSVYLHPLITHASTIGIIIVCYASILIVT